MIRCYFARVGFRSFSAATTSKAVSTALKPHKVNKTVPPVTAGLPVLEHGRKWENFYQQDRRVYQEHMRALRKQYMLEDFRIKEEWFNHRLKLWNHVQSTKHQRLLKLREDSRIREKLSNDRVKLIKKAYDTLRAQRGENKRRQRDKELRMILMNLAEMHQTSHRWIDSTNIEQQITTDLFNYRTPVSGLPAQRSEREEAMLSYYSSNERFNLPDSVFEALGLATESALKRKDEREARAREKEQEILSQINLNKTLEQDAIKLAQEEAEKISESSKDESESAIKASASDDNKAPTVAAETKVEKVKAAKVVKTVDGELDRELKQDSGVYLDNGLATKDSKIVNFSDPEILESPDTYLIASRFPEPSSDATIQQRFANLSLQSKHSTFHKNPKTPYISLAAEAMKNVGIDIVSCNSNRFDIWYAYMQYSYAIPEFRATKYAEFLTLLLRSQKIPIIISADDVNRIDDADAESRRIVEEVAEEIASERNRLIAEAGSVEKYNENMDKEALADIDEDTLSFKSEELKRIKNRLLQQTREARRKLQSDETVTIHAPAESLGKLAELLEASPDSLNHQRQAAWRADNVLHDRAIVSLGETSKFALFTHQARLSVAKAGLNSTEMTPEQAKDLTRTTVENVLAKKREKALKLKAQSELALNLSHGNPTSQALHTLSIVESRLNEERTRYDEQQLLREQKRLLLSRNGDDESKLKLAALEKESQEHRLRRELEELEAESALEKVEVTAEEWSEEEYLSALAAKAEERRAVDAERLERESLNKEDETLNQMDEIAKKVQEFSSNKTAPL